MLLKYLKPNLAKYAARLPRHPADDDVAYGNFEAENVLPLIRYGFIKSAIIPHPDAEEIAQNSHRLTAEDWALMGRYMSSAFHDSANSSNSLQHKDEDYINNLPTWLVKAISSRPAQKAYEKGNMLHINKPNTGQNGFAIGWHTDKGIAAHTTYAGATLQWASGKFNKDELSGLFNNPEYVPKENIHTLNPGDTMLIGPEQVHRSSPYIPVEGRCTTITPDL